jgi:hypothetical protein
MKLKGLEAALVMQIKMADDAALFEAQFEREHDDDVDTADDGEWRRSYYPSNIQEQYVVNAVSGAPYPFRVGSLESLRLFHVTDATGMCDSRGLRGAVNREPNHLYYTNPQEYMRHRGGRQAFDSALVEAWHSKIDRLFPSHGDSELDRSALETISNEYRTKVARQYEEAMARNAAERAVVAAAKERAAARLAWEEKLAEVIALNKSRAKAARKEERIAAKKVRNKQKRFLYRERRRRTALAAADKAARAARKSERRKQAYAKMRLRNEAPTTLTR